jgi:hypothetical protein
VTIVLDISANAFSISVGKVTLREADSSWIKWEGRNGKPVYVSAQNYSGTKVQESSPNSLWRFTLLANQSSDNSDMPIFQSDEGQYSKFWSSNTGLQGALASSAALSWRLKSVLLAKTKGAFKCHL